MHLKITTAVSLSDRVAHRNLHLYSPLYQIKHNNWNHTLSIDTYCENWHFVKSMCRKNLWKK